MKSKLEKRLSINSANYEALTDEERELIIAAKIWFDRVSKSRVYWNDSERSMAEAVKKFKPSYFIYEEEPK